MASIDVPSSKVVDFAGSADAPPRGDPRRPPAAPVSRLRLAFALALIAVWLSGLLWVVVATALALAA